MAPSRDPRWHLLPAHTRAVCVLLESFADSAGRIALPGEDVIGEATRLLQPHRGEASSIRRHIEALIEGGHLELGGPGLVADRRSAKAVRQARYRARKSVGGEPGAHNAVTSRVMPSPHNAVTPSVAPEASRGDALAREGGEGGAPDLGLSSGSESGDGAVLQLFHGDLENTSTPAARAHEGHNGVTGSNSRWRKRGQDVGQKNGRDVGQDVSPKRAHERYADAYATGMSRASGEAFAPPRAKTDLIQMATVHARAGGAPLTGEALIDWFCETAEAYRRARPNRGQYENGYSPAACLRWLNSGRPGETPARAPMRKGIQPPAPAGEEYWVPATGEEIYEQGGLFASVGSVP